jgi:hypothetical protein
LGAASPSSTQNASTPVAQEPVPSGSKKRRNVALIAAVIVVACALIAVAVIVGLNGNGDLTGIKNGEYLSYDASATMSGRTIAGSMRMDISNVTSSSLTMKVTATFGGSSQSEQQTVNFSGDSWATAQLGTSSGMANGSSFTYLGQESLTTVYGAEMTSHYSTQYSGYTYEFWSGANGCPYKMLFSYTSGMVVTCTLNDTNIKDFKT